VSSSVAPESDTYQTYDYNSFYGSESFVNGDGADMLLDPSMRETHLWRRIEMSPWEVVKRWWKRTEIPQVVERVTIGTLNVTDADGINGVDYERVLAGKALEGSSKFSRGVAARRIASLVKVDLGPVQETEANRLVAWRMCRDLMVKHGWRPHQIVENLAVAVEYVFVASKDEVLARMIRSTYEVNKRNLAAGLTYNSRGPSKWWNWWGAKHSNPVPPRR
jgi:hypothetical protein